MAEDLTATTGATDEPRPTRDKMRMFVGLSYQVALGLLAIALLFSRTDPGQLSTDGWLLLFLFLVISIVCEELGFSLSIDVTVDLGGLFSGAAVLTLGFNGLWVPLLANLYWLFKTERHRWGSAPVPIRLSHAVYNLSMNVLPLWLGLFTYQDLLGGELPLANLTANLGPTVAFVLVEWLVLLVAVLPLLVIAERGLRGAAQWLRGVQTGFALSVYVPMLFSPAVAVILNRLGLGFFLFIAVGLLGISLLAQRLAHSLAAERQRVEELSALNALSDDIIHSPPSIEVTGELLARHAPRFIPEADTELCLFEDGEPGHREVVVCWRDGAPQPAGQAPLTAAWAWLRDERQPLLVPDLTQRAWPFAWDDQANGSHPGSLPFAWDDQADGPRPGSLLLVPLLAADPAAPRADRCIGGMLMRHPRPRAFTAETLLSVTALAHQLSAALENARLYQEALAHERLERELTLARGIQTSFLPAGVPQVAGWTFVTSLEPARHVSGDFYDFIPLPGDRWGILIADVADKGMPAALYMALARTLARAHAPDHADDPAACLVAVNDQILSDTQADLFVTAFYGILDPVTGEMAYANAGHNPPLFCHRDGRPVDLLRNTGMALGVVSGVPLDNARLVCAPGDYLVLYTDGVTEANDQEFETFGSKRLLAEVRQADAAPAKQIHHRIRAAVAEFAGAAPQADDITLMVVSRET